MKNPKRVLHFTPYFLPHIGGLEMYVKEWSSEYVARGGKVCIVTLSPGQILVKNQEEQGIKIIILPAYDIIDGFPLPLFFLPSFWRGLSEAKRWSPDIIHTHTRFFLSSFLGGVFAKILSLPWIHIEHGSGFVVSERKIIERISRLYDNTLGKWTLSRADTVVTVSKMCEEFVREVFHIDNAETIYRGIVSFQSHASRSQNEISIGYVGRLVDLKGVHILIQSFAKFMSGYAGKRKVTLKIIGDGKEKRSLEEETQSLGLEDSIVFLGKKDILEIREKYLPSFHIFINPSFQEGFPTTVIEALTAGCRVIATDVGGTREIHERFPFTLIPPGDTVRLTEAISIAITDVDKASTKPDESFFSWDETFDKFSRIYKDI